MIVMRGREYLAMRAHIKCTGPTKKYGSGILYVTTKRVAFESYNHGLCFERPLGLMPGEDWMECDRITREKGIFAIRNRVGLCDTQIKGKHAFFLIWFENDTRFEFHAEIQRHNGKRLLAHELDERMYEMTADRHYYNGWRQHVNKDDNVTWRGRKTDHVRRRAAGQGTKEY